MTKPLKHDAIPNNNAEIIRDDNMAETST